nr:MAG TPA: hypothetical protein [Bacteriophage sp.]
MKETQFIDDKVLRDKSVEHYEVLEKVKELLLIPNTKWATQKQVAEYYEVGEKAIETIYSRHRDELESDGVSLKSYKEFLNIQNEGLEISYVVGKTIFTFANGNELTVPNRGLKVFPRRAILRVGMLLRDSEVAKEVRTQLLNIEEKTSTETKIEDIEEEQKLMLSVGMAVASGDANAVAIASANLVAFKNRHIEKLQNDNKALAGEILSWSDRKKLNAGVRQLAAVTGIPFGNMWNELYKNLQYKYGICLKQRGGKPYIQWVDESEWGNVIKTFCAMCEAYDQSPTEMFQQTTPEIKPKGIRDLEKLRAKRISK